MLERIFFDKNGIAGLRQIVDDDLYTYSSEGLRTLLFAQRSICDEEYESFKKVFKTINSLMGQSKE